MVPDQIFLHWQDENISFDVKKVIFIPVFFDFPISFNGCLFLALSSLVSELRNLSDIGVFNSDGAIALTLILGANSAARDLVLSLIHI